MADKFANLANIEVNESAANTLTFEELNTGTAIFEKMAMIIHKIEYEPSAATMSLLLSGDDVLEFAWTTSNQITSIAKTSANVIDRMEIGMRAWGTPANAALYIKPFVHDFNSLPGGGLIVPATNLYCAVEGTSVASPIYLRSSLYFTYVSLKDSEFWELVEATRALT